MINRTIKNSNGTVDRVVANSYDSYDVMIGENYKLVKYSKSRKTFNDTFLGTDIGLHSNGFVNVAIISSLLAIGTIIAMYLFCRI